MLNIVVISGGTGSIALQNGFNKLYGKRNYNLDVIINAYDNGKSTGECRRVLGNAILGPSDLRKNQLTLFKITYMNEIVNEDSYEYKILNLFELRFSAVNYSEYYETAKAHILESDFLKRHEQNTFIKWLNYFFFGDQEQGIYRESVKEVLFEDFSLSNIFYAACASLNNNLLGAAGSEMAKILKIEDTVHLVSDVNLYLSAETESGYIIENESDIVCWDNKEDKIVKAILTDSKGNQYIPSIDEKNSKLIKPIIQNADIIIFSSGTQWSSLIPTYMHKGFAEMIKNTHAKKYLIMNNIEDHDMLGVSATKILNVLGQYLELSDITVVLNENALSSMNHVENNYRIICGSLSENNEKKHDPEKLVHVIMEDYFEVKNRGNFCLISDLDGTLWDERGDNYSKVIGKENLLLFNGIIISGNSYEHVYSITNRYLKNHRDVAIYCDYGNTYFFLNEQKGKTHILSERYRIDKDVFDELRKIEEFKDKITMRGGVVITIKPLSNRENKMAVINTALKKVEDEYTAQIAGKTSIDITKHGFSKAATLEQIMEKRGILKENVIYMGNELEKGHEECIRTLGVKTVQVDDIFEANIFLKVFERNYR